MSAIKNWGYTPLLPLYSEVRQMLPILENVPKSSMTQLISAIMEQTGTPQHPLDWSDPDTWVTERLTGEDAELAWRIWTESNRTVNPRHIRGSYYLINRHTLMDLNSAGRYQPSHRTTAFLDEDPDFIRTIDQAEHIPQLLGILATRTVAKSGDLLPEWSSYVRETSNYRSESSIKSLLRYRLRNLLERGLISREGTAYSITSSGLDYALPVPSNGEHENGSRQAVFRAINKYNQHQIDSLRELMARMDPYQFEGLVRDLLEAMGYEDASVTRESGDRGVDVVATVQFGITTITEVVQVKRHRGTISRPTVDQLRGALPYHDAIRGTIITLGGFSSGCADAALFPGAAPISLIDGNRLIELLVEHEIGVHQRPATLHEIDTELFAETDEQQEIEESLIEG